MTEKQTGFFQKKAVIFLLSCLLTVAIGLSVKYEVFADILQGRGSFQLEVGKTRQLQSQGGSAPYYWSTSDSSIVRIVEDDGGSAYARVQAVSEGRATIRLRSSKFVPTLYGGDTDTLIETWTVTVVRAEDEDTGTNNTGNSGGTNTPGGGAGGSNGGQTVNPPGGNRTTAPNQPVAVKRVKLNRTKANLKLGKTLNLTASLHPLGATGSVTWSSSKPKVASVSADGQVRALKAGKTTITARASNGKKASCVVRVVRPTVKKIHLHTKKLTVDIGSKTSLRYTLKPQNAASAVKCTSSKPKVAKVTKKGVIRAKKAGTTIITVKAANGVSAKCKVTVRPKAKKIKLNKTSVSLRAGQTQQLSAKIMPKKATKTTTWFSSNASVASVSRTGLVTAIRPGTAKITARTTSGKKAVCVVTVQSSEKQSSSGGSASSGGSSPSGGTVVSPGRPSTSGSSSSTGGSSGNGGSSSPGVPSIPATSIHITGEHPYIIAGDTISLRTSVAPSNTTDTVRWSSSNSSVATVSASGVVRGLRDGGVTITARSGSQSDSVNIAVVSGDVYDVSQGSIYVLGDNTTNDHIDYCGQEYKYDTENGVTIVQSDPSKSNFIRIGAGKVRFANVHLSRTSVQVIDYGRKEDSPYVGDIVIEFMAGTENSFSDGNAPIDYMTSSDRTGRLVIQGTGTVDLYSDYGPALRDNFITIREVTLTARTASENCAVIGSSFGNYCNDITVESSARITAYGGCKAVGAGEGGEESNISIAPGTVTWIP